MSRRQLPFAGQTRTGPVGSKFVTWAALLTGPIGLLGLLQQGDTDVVA